MDGTVIIVVFLGILAVVFFILFLFKTKEEKEYEQELKESLEDEMLTDPETGAKITLEQAESGEWTAPDVEYGIVPESEIELFADENDKEAQRAVNYILGQKQYRRYIFEKEETEVLEATRILSKYDSWRYSDLMKMEGCNAFVFLPEVELGATSRQLKYYKESQCMYWVILDSDMGHYYLREKEVVEMIVDLIETDDDLMLIGYESFTFEEADDVSRVNKVLVHFEGENGLEIEFMHHHLFLKNLKLVNLKDVQRMERIVRAIIGV